MNLQKQKLIVSSGMTWSIRQVIVCLQAELIIWIRTQYTRMGLGLAVKTEYLKRGSSSL